MKVEGGGAEGHAISVSLGNNFMFSCLQAGSMTPVPVSGVLGVGLERFSLDVTTHNPQKSLAWEQSKGKFTCAPSTLGKCRGWIRQGSCSLSHQPRWALMHRTKTICFNLQRP